MLLTQNPEPFGPKIKLADQNKPGLAVQYDKAKKISNSSQIRYWLHIQHIKLDIGYTFKQIKYGLHIHFQYPSVKLYIHCVLLFLFSNKKTDSYFISASISDSLISLPLTLVPLSLYLFF